MGILECASEASVWRGYHYYKERRVVYMEEIRAHVYAAAVQGTQKEPYAVKMDLDHPEESTCSCPYAMNMQVVCKHIVATYFAIFPEAAEALERATDEDYDVDDGDYDDDYDEDYDEDCDDEALSEGMYRASAYAAPTALQRPVATARPLHPGKRAGGRRLTRRILLPKALEAASRACYNNSTNCD